MKKVFSIIFCVLFFGICCVFSLGMIIPGASNIKESSDEFPKLFSKEGINHSFGDDLESWFSEAFAFRSELVNTYADMKVSALQEGNSQVIIGKDDFLFFTETLDSYTGISNLSDDDITKACETLLSVQNAAEASGAKFLFVCAPNKNTVYSDMMPDRYVKADTDSTEMQRLFDKLTEMNVSYIDLRYPLIEGAENELIYHKKDSHWNGLGAEIAFHEIAGKLGFAPVSLEGNSTVLDEKFEGDLDALLYTDEVHYDKNVTYDFEGLYVYTCAYSTPMDITITTRGGGQGKLLMYRDSFANALIPYAASSFSEVRFERAVPYNTKLIDSFDADYVIVEIAERNIKDLIDYYPVG